MALHKTPCNPKKRSTPSPLSVDFTTVQKCTTEKTTLYRLDMISLSKYDEPKGFYYLRNPRTPKKLYLRPGQRKLCRHPI